MIRFSSLICEMAEPTKKTLSGVYYHGTTRAKAQNIIKNGLTPDKRTSYYGDEIPMKGHVYITEDLVNAIMYASSGNGGCVLVFYGKNLIDVDPDEDIITKMILNSDGFFRRGVVNKIENEFGYIFDLRKKYPNMSDLEFSKYIIQNVLSDEQKQKIIDTIGINIAHKGKLYPDECWCFDEKQEDFMFDKYMDNPRILFKIAKRIY